MRLMSIFRTMAFFYYFCLVLFIWETKNDFTFLNPSSLWLIKNTAGRKRTSASFSFSFFPFCFWRKREFLIKCVVNKLKGFFKFLTERWTCLFSSIYYTMTSSKKRRWPRIRQNNSKVYNLRMTFNPSSQESLRFCAAINLRFLFYPKIKMLCTNL